MEYFARFHSATAPKFCPKEAWSMHWGHISAVKTAGIKNRSDLVAAARDIIAEWDLKVSDLKNCSCDFEVECILDEAGCNKQLPLSILAATFCSNRGYSCFAGSTPSEAIAKVKEYFAPMGGISKLEGEIIVFIGEYKGRGVDGEDLAVPHRKLRKR